MNTGVLRTLLLWLMIMIIPAQVLAGAASVSCSTQSGNSLAQADSVHGHEHHPMGSNSSDAGAEIVHVGCVLCATSCHGISALLSHNVEPFIVAAPVRVEAPAYLLFIGQTPEPLKRPPRTAHL